MSQPEIGRRVRQQGADIEVLHELVEGVDQKGEIVDQKVEALEARVDRGFGQVTQQLEEVLRLLNVSR